MVRTYDPSDLFAADAFASRAGMLCTRAVTAGEAGRFSEQRQLVAEAAQELAEALKRLNPAVEAQSHITGEAA